MDIRDLPSGWRGKLMPASYKGSPFHVDQGSVDNGRRIVLHEFPKKETPYAEDMGRRAYRFSVRAYCIQYPTYRSQLLQPDYTQPRNQLKTSLDTGGAGSLQLPLLPAIQVVCERYRLTEEEKYGGYCVFDIQFAEAGAAGGASANTQSLLISAAQAMSAQVVSQITAGVTVR
jgi:prophage DNA circulation protein